jgi:outer membrane protein OmpA-like peptidoglycan-associated protein
VIKLFLYILLISSLLSSSKAQSFYEIEGGSPSISYVKIEKVELSDSFSIFYMNYQYSGTKERWLCANDRYYLREETTNPDEKKRLIKAENLPTCPDKHIFQTGESLNFKLYFPPLSSDKVMLTFIQGTEPVNTSSNLNYYFNFYGFKLKPIPNSSTKVQGSNSSKIAFQNQLVGLNDSIYLPILFAHGEEKLDEPSIVELEKLYQFLTIHPTVQIELQGHTERDLQAYTKNQRKLNYTLSDKRVKKVKEYLVNKGIEAKRIRTRAFGGTQPISIDEQKNRRVVMKIIKM